MTRREGDERGGREEGGEKNMAGKEKRKKRFRSAWPFFLFFITPLLSVALPALTRLGLLH